MRQARGNRMEPALVRGVQHRENGPYRCSTRGDGADGGPALSTYQQPGRGYRPLALAADRTLDALTEQRAPITLRQYVAPLGNGWHLIRRDCNEASYEASSSTGATFREGETVAVVGEAGLRGEIIIGPAATATADYPTVALGLNLSLDIPAPAPANACPAAITGRSYLGIRDDGTTLYAYRYTDGAYQETLGSYAYTAAGWSALASFQRVNTETEAVVFYGRKAGSDHVLAWDIDGAAVYELDTTSDHMGGPIWTGGTDVYFSVNFSDVDGVHITLHKVALYATGTVDLGATQQGTELLDATGFLFVPDAILLWSTGPKFQIPCLWFETGTEVVIPYWSGGAWNLGAGRATIAGPEDNGVQSCGYAASSGASARISYTIIGSPNVGMMPSGPATPETALIPADWSIIAVENMSLNAAGSQVALFPVQVDGEGDLQDKLLRLPLQGLTFPTGCPLNRITVEEAPEGLPTFMLCRD